MAGTALSEKNRQGCFFRALIIIITWKSLVGPHGGNITPLEHPSWKPINRFIQKPCVLDMALHGAAATRSTVRPK